VLKAPSIDSRWVRSVIIEQQTRNLFLPGDVPRDPFVRYPDLVRCWAGEEGALGGLEICCGAWAVRHFPFGHPPITLSHFPSFSDGQGHRQALQLPQPCPFRELFAGEFCSMESIFQSVTHSMSWPPGLECSPESILSPGQRPHIWIVP
jgi:hypothetical protein